MRKAFFYGAMLLIFGSLFAEAKSKHERPWVGTWSCAPQKVETQNLPPSPGLQGNLLRQVVRVTIGGDELRLRFSNEFGDSPLVFESVAQNALSHCPATCETPKKSIAYSP